VKEAEKSGLNYPLRDIIITCIYVKGTRVPARSRSWTIRFLPRKWIYFHHRGCGSSV